MSCTPTSSPTCVNTPTPYPRPTSGRHCLPQTPLWSIGNWAHGSPRKCQGSNGLYPRRPDFSKLHFKRASPARAPPADQDDAPGNSPSSASSPSPPPAPAPSAAPLAAPNASNSGDLMSQPTPDPSHAPATDHHAPGALPLTTIPQAQEEEVYYTRYVRLQDVIAPFQGRVHRPESRATYRGVAPSGLAIRDTAGVSPQKETRTALRKRRRENKDVLRAKRAALGSAGDATAFKPAPVEAPAPVVAPDPVESSQPLQVPETDRKSEASTAFVNPQQKTASGPRVAPIPNPAFASPFKSSTNDEAEIAQAKQFLDNLRMPPSVQPLDVPFGSSPVSRAASGPAPNIVVPTPNEELKKAVLEYLDTLVADKVVATGPSANSPGASTERSTEPAPAAPTRETKREQTQASVDAERRAEAILSTLRAAHAARQSALLKSEMSDVDEEESLFVGGVDDLP